MARNGPKNAEFEAAVPLLDLLLQLGLEPGALVSVVLGLEHRVHERAQRHQRGRDAVGRDRDVDAVLEDVQPDPDSVALQVGERGGRAIG